MFKKRFPFFKNKKALFLALFLSTLAVINIIFFSVFLMASGKDLIKKSFSQDINAERLANSFAAACQNDNGWRNCYGKKFSQLTSETDNLDDVLKVLTSLQKVDQKTRDCHIIAHETTKKAVEKDPANWKEVLDVIDPNSCTYGFIHGVVEMRSRYDSSFVLNAKTIPPFCDLLLEMKKTRGIDQTCAHIVGHLVLTQEYGDIPKAVNICYGIAEVLQRECFSGLFMEQYTRDNLVAHGVAEYIPWTEGTIQMQEHLCNSYDGNAGLGCWQAITSMYLQITPFDPDEIYRRCSAANKLEYVDRCYGGGIVGLISAPEEIADEDYYASICGRYENDSGKFDECMNFPIRGLLMSSIDNYDKAAKYCEAISQRYQSMCYGLIGDVLDQIVSPSEKTRFCNILPKDMVSNCMSDEDYWEV